MEIYRTDEGFRCLFSQEAEALSCAVPGVVVDLAQGDVVAGVELISPMFCLRQEDIVGELPTPLPAGITFDQAADCVYVYLQDPARKAPLPLRSVHPPVVAAEILLSAQGRVVGVAVRCPEQFALP